MNQITLTSRLGKYYYTFENFEAMKQFFISMQMFYTLHNQRPEQYGEVVEKYLRPLLEQIKNDIASQPDEDAVRN